MRMDHLRKKYPQKKQDFRVLPCVQHGKSHSCCICWCFSSVFKLVKPNHLPTATTTTTTTRGHHHFLQVPGPPVPGSTSTIFRATKLWVSAKTPWTWTETCVTRRFRHGNSLGTMGGEHPAIISCTNTSFPPPKKKKTGLTT